MKDLCGRICDCHVNGSWVSSSADPQQLNDPADDVYTDIDELKLGQKLNSEAIQTLSHSVSEMASQFQFLVDKNKTDINNSTSTKATQTCIMGGPADHSNAHCADVDVSSFVIEESINSLENNRGIIISQSTNEDNQNNYLNAHSADVDVSSFVMEESINPLENNRDPLSVCFNTTGQAHALNSENKKDSATTDSSIIINDAAEKEDQLTYAKVAALKPAVNNNTIEINGHRNHESPGNLSHSQRKPNSETNNNSGISAEGFVGVERRRNKTKRLFLSGIASNVSENHIQSYLERRGINPTYISVFPSRRKGSVSAKVHIPSAVFPLVQDGKFWPRFVTCKLWKSHEKKEKTANVSPRPKVPQGGNLSTYV